MNIVLLDAKTLGSDLDITALESFGTLTVYQTTSKEETLERIQNADIIITNKVIISADMMQATPTLKLICIAATGMNNVDLEAAKAKGIEVKNVAGYSTKSVVQHTFAMALYLLEKMAYYDSVVKDGSWSASGLFTDVSQPFYEISGKKWGIIGFGTIGQEVAKVATAFGAEVSYHSTSGENLHHDYPHQSLEELLKDCDIISIHAPLNDATYNLINENNLSLIKEGAILLNLGRGGIVNERDLAFELDRRILYAGLDVLEKEPLTLDNSLNEVKHKERLLITPHMAWASIEARKKLLEGIVENIQRFMERI
ncbi:D-2-hydroxyacid dehydrogenase [Sulfurovum sp. AR]|uniref:D-2-hydroxyacid dehydrogenase n=1 Tax=Sulfurovum sp. AR TaxID=1165841 RepID=UPI00025C4DAD|nr:D-2-hydroxyacid dehydrogenase [Sulfurovum sp. AR]EIF50052.1 D-isomer specific 2-hydroxyacid dehydrogenase, catalytic component [Sulfurovum sp. AR]